MTDKLINLWNKYIGYLSIKYIVCFLNKIEFNKVSLFLINEQMIHYVSGYFHVNNLTMIKIIINHAYLFLDNILR